MQETRRRENRGRGEASRKKERKGGNGIGLIWLKCMISLKETSKVS